MDPRRPTPGRSPASVLGGDVQYTEELPLKVAWSLLRRPGRRYWPMGPTNRHQCCCHRILAIRVAIGGRGRRSGCSARAWGRPVIARRGGHDGQTAPDGPWESEQTRVAAPLPAGGDVRTVRRRCANGDAQAARGARSALLQVLFHARIAEDARAPVRHRRCRRCAGAQVDKLRFRRARRGRISLEEQLASGRSASPRRSWRRPGTRAPTMCPPVSRRWRWAQKILERVSAAGLPGRSAPCRWVRDQAGDAERRCKKPWNSSIPCAGPSWT